MPKLNKAEKETSNEILHLVKIIQSGGSETLQTLQAALGTWLYTNIGKRGNRKKKLEFLTRAMGTRVGKPVKIDIGCGVRKKEGFIGLDDRKFKGVDIVADLTKGLPFKDNSVDEVWSNHFLEHLVIEDVCKVMEEIHRACKPWAYVEIRVPHFSGLTNFYEFHKTSFRYNSFSEYILAGWGMYDSLAHFYPISTKINVVNRQSPKLRPHTKWLIWNYPIEWIVNKMPLFYELTGFRNLFPAWELIFKLRVVK